MIVDNPRVSIVILNWNGWKDTIECLESLFQISYPIYNIIVIDNGSKDDSVTGIKKYANGNLVVGSKFFEFSTENKPIEIREYTKEGAEAGEMLGDVFTALPSNKKMILIKNDKNYGFAEGCNIGIRYAFAVLEPEYVLLLNNDTVVESNFLDELVKATSTEECIGFVGPIVYYYDYNGRKDVINSAGVDLILRSGSTRHIGMEEVDRGQYDGTRIVDSLEGSCLLIRKKVLDEIGLFKSSFFAYWEETDLCKRGSDAGYKCACVQTAKIWHKISSSATSKFFTYQMIRNRLWFMKDHTSTLEYYSFLGYFFFREFPVYIGVYLRRRDIDRLSSFLKGIFYGLTSRYD
jgi:GT2 family glycosyltransferase